MKELRQTSRTKPLLTFLKKDPFEDQLGRGLQLV